VKTKLKTKWLGAAMFAVLGLAGRSQAAPTPGYLYIDVTITNNMSVTVIGAAKSTQTVTWAGETALTAPSTATVTNSTSYFAERWELTTTANAADATDGSAGWAIASSAGADQVKLQATFGSASAPSGAGTCAGAAWQNSLTAPTLLSSTQQVYTASVLSDSTMGATYQPDNTSTGRMNPGSSRALCWKMTMPTSTSLSNQQIVPIVVTAF